MRAIKSFWTNNLPLVRNFSRRSVEWRVQENSAVLVSVCVWAGEDGRRASRATAEKLPLIILQCCHPSWFKSSLLSQRDLGNGAQDSQEGWAASNEHMAGAHPGPSAFLLIEATSQIDSSVFYSDSAPQLRLQLPVRITSWAMSPICMRIL